MENRKHFLDALATKLNLHNPKDWGKVSTRTFWKLGGRGLLRYYQDSLFNCLQSIYKGDEILYLSNTTRY